MHAILQCSRILRLRKRCWASARIVSRPSGLNPVAAEVARSCMTEAAGAEQDQRQRDLRDHHGSLVTATAAHLAAGSSDAK